MKIFTKLISKDDLSEIFYNLIKNKNIDDKVKLTNQIIDDLLKISTESLDKKSKNELLKSTIKVIEKEIVENNKECTNPDYMCC
ncbi:MAG TPA: hypothetical protein ENK67_08405 [Flavobacteriia bacterium]|nr:hypothetical protein [Flavobacteriia bacterium]